MTASSVICFKTGYSFISIPVQLGHGKEDKEGEVRQCEVGPIPSFAVHGTVSLQPWEAEEVQVLSLAKRPEEGEALKIPTGQDFSLSAILEENLGTKVVVCLEEGQGLHSRTCNIEGKVKWIQPRRDSDHQTTRLACIEDAVGKIKVDKMVDCSKLVRVERSILVDQGDDKSGSLVVRYIRTGPTLAPMATLSFLTKGLTWAPSYSILLDKVKKTLKLDGQACLLCDLPFFNGEPVGSISLVVGQQKVELETLCDPLASGKGAMAFIQQAMILQGQNKHMAPGAPPPPPPSRSQYFMMNSKKSSGYGSRPMARRGSFASLEDLEDFNQSVEGIKLGETVEDFFHYQLESVPLKFDQPLSMPFLKQQGGVKYEDIYYLDLDKKVQVATSEEDEKSSVEVMHAITFKNPTGQPLTTAPVSVLAREEGDEGQGKFLVQAMMKFTAPEKPVTVEITRSFEVKVRLGRNLTQPTTSSCILNAMFY